MSVWVYRVYHTYHFSCCLCTIACHHTCIVCIVYSTCYTWYNAVHDIIIYSYTQTRIHSYTTYSHTLHTLIHSYAHTLHTLIHSHTHTLKHSYTHTLIYLFILSQICQTTPLFRINSSFISLLLSQFIFYSLFCLIHTYTYTHIQYPSLSRRLC